MPIDMQLESGSFPKNRPAASTRRTFSARLNVSAARVGTRDRMLFTERLSLQLETGVALHKALQSLLEQTEKPALRVLIEQLIDKVVGGGKFSEALAQHPELFPKTYVNLVKVGENGGFLNEILDQLNAMDEKQERLRHTIISALSYPGFLMFFSVAVVLFVLAVVFPKFTSIFTPIYAKLPVTTKGLLWASELLTRYPLHICVTFTVAVTAIWGMLNSPAGKAWQDRAKLSLPILKDIYLGIYLTRLMRTMGISLQHGVTILSTLGACREVVANIQFQRFLERLEMEVSEGKGIAAGFRDTTFIPPTVVQMIATGEEAGKLGHVMSRIADFYDGELTKRLNSMAKMAEPIMLLVMGGAVGLIVSSLILPIFKLSSSIR